MRTLNQNIRDTSRHLTARVLAFKVAIGTLDALQHSAYLLRHWYNTLLLKENRLICDLLVRWQEYRSTSTSHNRTNRRIWHQDSFIVMKHVPGRTLDTCWSSLAVFTRFRLIVTLRH